MSQTRIAGRNARLTTGPQAKILSKLEATKTLGQSTFLSPLLILGEGEGEVTRSGLGHTLRPQPAAFRRTFPRNYLRFTCWRRGVALVAAVLVSLALARNAPAGSSATAPVYNEIIGTGQSLAMGLFANPAISITAQWPNAALMTNLGVRQLSDRGQFRALKPILITALVPLVEASTPDHDGETIGAGMTFEINDLARAAGQPPWPVVFSMHGVTGASYAMLKRGTMPYRNSLETVKRVATMLRASGIRDVVRAVTVSHGETDFEMGATAADYEADLVQWRSDYDADLRAITGQHERVMLFTDQMSNYTSTVFGSDAAATSPIPLAQLNAAIHHPDTIVLVCPKYWLTYYPKDGAHLTNRSEELLGEKYGEAIKRTFVDGAVWKPLYITGAAIKANVITLSYHIPSPPIVLDTTLIRDPGNFGFVYTDDSPAPPSIRAVEVDDDGRQVLIHLSAAPTAPAGHRHVQYAYVGSLSCGGGGCGAGPISGPRGNLRDSDPLTSRLDGGNSIHLYNWAAIQDLVF
jgi:hypothetical protein